MRMKKSPKNIPLLNTLFVQKGLIILFIIGALFQTVEAQDIDDLLDAELGTQKDYATATFKSTHIINGHSVAQMKKKHLNFLIYHRFGSVDGGIDQFFGIDNANMRLGFEYATTDWLTIGVGRTNFEKTYDGFIKARILRQSKGGKFSMPVSLSYIAIAEVFSRPFIVPDRENLFSSRWTYVHQLLIARKFNNNLSLQLMPTLLHKNLVKRASDSNNVLALGVGGRYKFSKRVALTFEYYVTRRANTDHQDPISFGVDIETGGHVFQLMVSNSPLMQEGGFIYGMSNDEFFKGGVHIGFNITRVFSFDKNR